MDVEAFLKAEGVDEYVVVRIDDLPDADRSDLRCLVPGARSIIVFGTEIPVPVYEMAPREKTREMLRIAESLDRTAARLVNFLNAENFRSVRVPLYLPLRVESGRIRGIVRLKQIAARGGLGTIGKSSLLISPQYGNRLVLSGVVTEQETEHRDIPPAADFCGNCDRCVRACPGGAIGPEGVDAFQCRNISSRIPALLVPAAIWLLGHDSIQRLAAPFAPWVARRADTRCSLCVKVCPLFRSGVISQDTKKNGNLPSQRSDQYQH
jgi:epoxyqueuosine reductase